MALVARVGGDARRTVASSYIVIPARLASTRLPSKLLLSETGKTLLQHTYEAAQTAAIPQGVLVAADHEEIAAAVRAFGGNVLLTSPQCASGTDRVAEVARGLDVDVVVNVQGDEPELSGNSIDRVVQLLEERPEAAMATLATPIRNRKNLDDPSLRQSGVRYQRQGIVFQPHAIPHARQWDDRLLTADPPHFYLHVGLYAYRREFLLRLSQIPRTPLEKLEELEQLRVLESGDEIVVGVVDEPTVGIDTPDDYRAFVSRMRGR